MIGRLMERTGTRGTVQKREGDEGAALLLTIFLMLLVASLSITIGSTVLLQAKPTQYQQKSTRTLGAAEAGFDVALNKIRSAQDAAGNGVRTSLPCTATAGTTLTGLVGPGADASRYTVTIRYYAQDPVGQPESWRSSTANLIACSGGVPTTVPTYALLESTGTGAALKSTTATADRTVEQTYRFRLTNVNIPGGVIVNNGTDRCLEVANHNNNARVRVQTCQSDSLLQKWSYTPQLLLKTVDAAGNDYCIEATPSDGAQVRITSTCDATQADQLWSFNDYGRFEGAVANAAGQPTGATNGWCLTVQGNNINSTSHLHMKQECAGAYDTTHTFNPAASVGAGAAGDATRQLVNYRYFGRCLDITGRDRNATWLIGYPCKQAPDPAYISWNQKFFWDAGREQLCADVTNATVTSCAPTANKYCLAAGTAAAPAVNGTRVLLRLCSATDPSHKWTRRFDTGSYATSYTILTKTGGLCLELNPTAVPEAPTYEIQWGTILAATCDGSTRQKWNAPANLTDTTTLNTYEHLP